MWQWRSFLNTGSAGLFLFGYSFVYFSSTLEIMGVVSTMLYFTYMFVASMLFTLVTGKLLDCGRADVRCAHRKSGTQALSASLHPGGSYYKSMVR